MLNNADALRRRRDPRGLAAGGRASRCCARPTASGRSATLQAGRPARHRGASTTTSSTTTARSPPPATTARSTWTQGRGEFAGDPVVVTSDRGRIEAPRMVYNTDQQIVNARGGVQGACCRRWRRRRSLARRLLDGQGPVHVESQEAFWRQQPSSFIFRGDVRAWRGREPAAGAGAARGQGGRPAHRHAAG